MSNLDSLLKDVEQEILNEECVQHYFYYKNIIKNDKELKALDEEMKFHQKEMCKNKNNEKVYQKEKSLYDELKIKFESNPVLINYQIAKEEVMSLLTEIKEVLN